MRRRRRRLIALRALDVRSVWFPPTGSLLDVEACKDTADCGPVSAPHLFSTLAENHPRGLVVRRVGKVVNEVVTRTSPRLLNVGPVRPSVLGLVCGVTVNLDALGPSRVPFNATQWSHSCGGLFPPGRRDGCAVRCRRTAPRAAQANLGFAYGPQAVRGLLSTLSRESSSCGSCGAAPRSWRRRSRARAPSRARAAR